MVSWRGQLERKEKSVNLSIQDGKSNQLIRFRRQGRIFIFGSLGYFQLGALLEGSRRPMSYKLALEVLATFTEQVVPIHKHIILFWIPSISGTKTVIMKLTKKSALKLSANTHSHHIFIEFHLQLHGLQTSRARSKSWVGSLWLANQMWLFWWRHLARLVFS